MNKIINQKSILGTSLLYVGMITLILIISLGFTQTASAAIVNQLELGSTGSDVTELQTFLARTASIYPEGLITGYFGQLTEAAVKRFQVAYGIVSSGSPSTTGYGRVGPTTIARINALMGSISPIQTWDTGPTLNNIAVQTDENSAKITWTTNEQTQGQVYYDDAPLSLTEATGPRQQPYVSGTLALDGNGGLQTSHSITISNLESDTVYYYLTRVVDNVGNVNMTWPASFRTDD